MSAHNPFTSLFFIFTVLFFPFTVFAEKFSGIELNEKELAWVRAHPTLTVANEMDWPPFDFADATEPKGYSIDLIRLIAKKTGWEPKFVNGFTWSELLNKFKLGQIDVMPAIYVNDERKAFTEFTRSYISQPSVIIVKKDNDDIIDVASLSGKRVAGIVDFAITNALKVQVPDIKFIPINNAIEGIKAVSMGKADAMVDSIGVVTHILENNFIPNVKTVVNVNLGQVENPALHMGVAKDNKILRNILEKALLSISREEKQQLYDRWFQVSTGRSRIELTREQQDWISKHPVIRIGIDGDYAPYSLGDKSGQFLGIVPDYIRIIGQRLGIKFQAIPNLSWAEIIESSKDRTIDVIATAVATKERREFLNFTPVYIKTPLVIMTRTDEDNIIDATDLKNRPIALVKKYSSSQRIIKEHPKVQPLWVDNPTEGLHAVATGKADAYVGVLGVNIYLSRKNGIANLKVAGQYDLVSNGQRFAVRSDWPELALLLDDALASISEEERQYIYDKWIRLDYEEVTNHSLLIKSILIFLTIIALLYFYIRKLASEVKKRKYAEQELIKANATLTEAKMTVDEANEKLKELDRLKSLFIASMSHELRTPLNSIIGFTGIIKDKMVGDVNDKQKDFLGRVYKSSKHLLSMISDVIDISKVESGAINAYSDNFCLDEVLNQVADCSQSLKRKEISLSVNCPKNIEMHSDQQRISQCVLNLLSNAIKYTPKGNITISAREVGDYAEITVQDTGIGISKADLYKLFQPFERLKSPLRVTEAGTGLGLYLTRKLAIDILGGSLDVESQVGIGSIFCLKIPKKLHQFEPDATLSSLEKTL